MLKIMKSKLSGQKSKIDIRKIAKLANLTLSKSQEKELLAQVENTIAYVSVLQQLDTSGVVETAQVTDSENIFREDSIDLSRVLTQKEALSNAKRHHGGYFVVDQILEEKS